jgi:hypothetical protein
LNNNEKSLSTLEQLLNDPEHRNWDLICEVGHKLSDEGRSLLVEEAILALKRLPELGEVFQKIHNVKCPVERCEALLPVRSTDSGVHVCTCRNHHLLIGWDKEAPMIGVIKPIVEEPNGTGEQGLLI